MLRQTAVVFLVMVGSFATLHGQKGKPPGMPAGMPDPAQMQAAADAAQKNAKRPGDEVMSCEAGQNELVATMQDPKVQTVIGKQGAWAKQQQDKLNAGMAAANGGPSKGSIAAQMAKGFATSMVPGAGMAQVAAQQAQAKRQIAESAQNQADMFARMNEMMTIMPQMMRAQRLAELGQNKKCDWAQESGGAK